MSIWQFSQLLLLTTSDAIMPSSLDKIIESFPHPTILLIVGQPTYKTLDEIHLKLNTNATSVHSHLGNGQLGLLYLKVLPDVYNTQSAISFVPPPTWDHHRPSPTVALDRKSAASASNMIWIQNCIVNTTALKRPLNPCWSPPSTRLIYVPSVTSKSVTPT